MRSLLKTDHKKVLVWIFLTIFTGKFFVRWRQSKIKLFLLVPVNVRNIIQKYLPNYIFNFFGDFLIDYIHISLSPVSASCSL